MSSLLVDYAIFGLLILATFLFNIYSSVSGPKEKTKADYAFASGNAVSTWAMLLSIARGFLGVRVFLGYPSELFYRGSEMWETLYGMILAFPVISYFFVPVYYSLGITSVYQYLDLRFKSRLVRCLASGTYVVRSLLNLAVTVFTPCVALKTVIGIPYYASIIGISFISIFFTVMGGLRSAIMADVAQGIAMIACSVVIIIQGMIEMKGPVNVVKIAHERHRLDFFNFDLDPTQRVTTISALIGQFFISMSLYGCQQNFVQRYLSMKSVERVQKTLWLNIPFMTILFSSSWIVGLVVYANYADCDPKALNLISSIDEIIPFYIEDKFIFLPGFLGLTMACLFNGSLSLVVSNLNSMAIVTWEDFLTLIPYFKNSKDAQQLFVIKCTGAVLGLFVMGVAFSVAHFSGVIESSMLMTSATSGPLLGVFILAMFFPSTNWKGASAGMIVSHMITLWIVYGALTMDKPAMQYLPTSVDGCTNETFSQHIGMVDLSVVNATKYLNNTQFDMDSDEDYTDSLVNTNKADLEIVPAQYDDILTSIYKMTYMYYGLLGSLITVVVGVIVSYITGIDEEYRYGDNLVHPLARKLSNWLPGQEIIYENDNEKSNCASTSRKGSANSTMGRSASKVSLPLMADTGCCCGTEVCTKKLKNENSVDTKALVEKM